MTAASRPWWWPWSRQEKLSFSFSQKWVFTFPSCRYSHKFVVKAFPQNLIENLYGPPFWASSFISLTDSCSPHWGSRVTYYGRRLCSEDFLFTRRRGSKEQIYYWWELFCVFWLFSIYIYTLFSSYFEYVAQEIFEELCSKMWHFFSIACPQSKSINPRPKWLNLRS